MGDEVYAGSFAVVRPTRRPGGAVDRPPPRPRRRRAVARPDDCENPHHDGPRAAIAVVTKRAPKVCICGSPERHASYPAERRCYDCVANLLMYWPDRCSVVVLPGREMDLDSARQRARLFREEGVFPGA